MREGGGRGETHPLVVINPALAFEALVAELALVRLLGVVGPGVLGGHGLDLEALDAERAAVWPVLIPIGQPPLVCTDPRGPAAATAAAAAALVGGQRWNLLDGVTPGVEGGGDGGGQGAQRDWRRRRGAAAAAAAPGEQQQRPDRGGACPGMARRFEGQGGRRRGDGGLPLETGLIDRRLDHRLLCLEVLLQLMLLGLRLRLEGLSQHG